MTSTSRYRPEIDGLRAVAVLPVLLFHLHPAWLPGGYLGVDVFFVISGFLITGILTREMREGRFRFWGFWERRIRRIFPVLAASTAASLGVSWAFGFAGDQGSVGWQGVSALLSVANVYFWRSAGNYWGTSAENSVFLHTWSLSVEEQFYLLFPLLLWLLHRARRGWTAGAMGCGLLASLFLFLWGSENAPGATFYLLPTRAWELLAGALLSLGMTGIRPANPEGEREEAGFSDALCLLGLGLIAASYVFVDGSGGVNSGTAFAVLGAALVIGSPGTGLGRWWLSLPPMIYVGKLSYSLYVWHWPVIVLNRQLELNFGSVWLALLSVLLAVGSYHLIEQTTRRRRGVLPWILATYGGVVLLALAMACFGGRSLYDTSGFNQPVFEGSRFNLNPDSERDGGFAGTVAGVEVPPARHLGNSFRHSGVVVGEADTPDVVILGDSHAVMWASQIETVVRDLGLTASFFAMNGVDPFVDQPIQAAEPDSQLSPEDRSAYDRARLDRIAEWKPQVVILIARWSTVSLPNTRDLMWHLQKHAGTVLLVEQPAEAQIGQRSMFQYLAWRGFKPDDTTRRSLPLYDPEALQRGRDLIRTLANTYSNAVVVPMFDLYQAEDGGALVLDGRETVFLDDDHLTEHGASLGIHRIRQALAEVFASSGDSPERADQPGAVGNSAEPVE